MKTLRNGWIYSLADETMVEAKEIEHDKWHLWSVNDNREYEIKPNGDIVLLPYKVGTIDDLVDTGLIYDSDKEEVKPRK